MARGKPSSRCARLALVAIALALAACTNTSPPPRELAGRYELVGVMEIGSQLLLHERGTFEAVLYYGFTDINARGRWFIVDGQVELDVRPKPTLPKEALGIAATDFTEPSTAAESNANYRLSSFSMSLDAMQPPLEVRWVFDDDSEQQTAWNASVFEDVVLPVRAGRTLKMLGVRASRTNDDFVWAEVLPDERHFTVIRTLLQAGELRSFFHKMKLTPRGNCLLVDMGANTGCYRRR